MGKWDTLANDASINKTVEALKAKGLEVHVVANGAEAKKAALSLIPEGSEVFTSASLTVDSIGLSKEINESGKYDAVKPKLYGFDQKTQAREARKYGAAPDFIVGSAHALTETGSVVVASLTGSQLGAYSYAAGTVVWIIGAQKIVKNLDDAFARIQEHSVPLETVRARKAYGLPDTFNSAVLKLFVFNGEANPARLKIIIVKESLGF